MTVLVAFAGVLVLLNLLALAGIGADTHQEILPHGSLNWWGR
ncbi:hypothetical protein [Lolliginicoccus lacisalsi]|nr:hypothetical protein [Lolliginicoccus lacisalsi]